MKAALLLSGSGCSALIAFALALGSTVSNAHGNADTPSALLNIDFGGTDEPAGKVGFAATGQSEEDFWNFYTRNDGSGGWNVNGALANLALADGTATQIGLLVENAPGAWGLGSTDPMYDSYIYPLGGGNVTVTLTNLPSGQYDVYVYSADGNGEVTVNGVSYGLGTSREHPVTNPPVWTEGVQYALFSGVQITSGESLVLTMRPGESGLPLLSGLQIAAFDVTNRPPTADAGATDLLVISSNGSNAPVILDGSMSSDPDGHALQYVWFDESTSEIIGTGITSNVLLPVGTNLIMLVVNDGVASGEATIVVEVITINEAIERLIRIVNTDVAKSRPLIASLFAALRSVNRDHPIAAVHQLRAFQHKVRSQLEPIAPELAGELISAADEVIESLADAIAKRRGKIRALIRLRDGGLRLQGDADPAQVYTIQVSTNFVNWETIGTVTNQSDGAFEFDDMSPPQSGSRYYRLVLP